jgi:signal transduction histidine kinase
LGQPPCGPTLAFHSADIKRTGTETERRPTLVKNATGRSEHLLKKRLLLAFFGVSLLPLFGSNAVGFLRSREIVEGLVQRYLLGVADLQATHIQERVDQMSLYLEAITVGNRFLQAALERDNPASDLEMRNAATPEATRDYLRRKLVESSLFDALSLFDEDGKLFASTSDRPRSGEWLLVEHMPVQFVTTGTASPPTLRYSEPVFGSQAQPLGFLVATIPLARGGEFLDIPEHVAGDIESFIVDEAGRPAFVSHEHGPLRFDRPLASPLVSGDAGRTARYQDREGEPVIAASADLPRLGWRFVAEVPIRDALRDLQGLRTLSWILGGAFSLLVLAAGWILASGIVAPVQRLVFATRKLAAGDLKVRVPERGNDEIAELSGAFNEMATQLAASRNRVDRLHRKEIERAEQLATVGELASGVAHEIKNPVVGISNGLDLVLRHVQDQPDLTPITTEMKRQLKRIELAVRDLLAFARPRQPTLQPLDLNEVVARAAALVEPRAQKEGVDLRVEVADTLPTVYGDAELLGQAAVNLLINAIQFSEEGSSVVVATSRGRGEVAISVLDNGPGIPPDVLGSLFKPFFTTRHSGTGLGLSITRGIAEGHGGRIEVDSSPGEGSSFRLVLPLKKEETDGGGE